MNIFSPPGVFITTSSSHSVSPGLFCGTLQPDANSKTRAAWNFKKSPLKPWRMPTTPTGYLHRWQTTLHVASGVRNSISGLSNAIVVRGIVQSISFDCAFKVKIHSSVSIIELSEFDDLADFSYFSIYSLFNALWRNARWLMSASVLRQWPQLSDIMHVYALRILDFFLIYVLTRNDNSLNQFFNTLRQVNTYLCHAQYIWLLIISEFRNLLQFIFHIWYI